MLPILITHRSLKAYLMVSIVQLRSDLRRVDETHGDKGLLMQREIFLKKAVIIVLFIIRTPSSCFMLNGISSFAFDMAVIASQLGR